MLNGATLAVDEANAAGGYCGKPFRLTVHNDYDNWQVRSAATAGTAKSSDIWGSASSQVIKMVYDDKVWAIFGSISSESTHIALRVALKAEVPIVNSASTDPTIPETIIPWYFTDIQDDRVQGYTLARHIYTELGFKRVAILRVNDRYGRFGVIKFRDASRRLGHPVVIEQKFMPSDSDYRRQLRVIQDSRVDAIVLWTDIGPAAEILKQMHELGLKQRVFGSHRTIGDELVKLAGLAAEGFEAVYPYDPAQRTQKWLDFNNRFAARFHEAPDHFAALAYDAMRVLLNSICRAGLNRGRIRDALTGVTDYDGVTGHIALDPNCKNISPMFLASVHDGKISYRKITMEKIAAREATESSGPAQPYARVGEDGVRYLGPALPDAGGEWKIAVFGPQAGALVKAPEIAHLVNQLNLSGHPVSLIGVSSDVAWGKASTALVQATYDQHALGIIALDRASSHLAEQIGVKTFVPVIAIASDQALTTTNIPWIFRLPPETVPGEAVRVFAEAIKIAGPNRGRVREVLASGAPLAGLKFHAGGELEK